MEDRASFLFDYMEQWKKFLCILDLACAANETCSRKACSKLSPANWTEGAGRLVPVSFLITLLS